MELTAEAMEAIGDYYAELRGGSDSRALPITVGNRAVTTVTCRTLIGRLTTGQQRMGRQHQGMLWLLDSCHTACDPR